MPAEITLRAFQWGDVPAITSIYKHYVENSVVTFDLVAPGERAMADKFGGILEAGHPLIVAERDGAVLGYAYASTYRPRPAYRFTCEDSLYIAPDAVGQGLGSLMMDRLIAECREFGFQQMIAVITGGTGNSIALHTKFGFRHVGLHEKLGFKFDQWHDIVHMQLGL